jgi:hypothetical protein
MAYTSLQQRLTNLPLVICGPILRDVSADSVTVWVALKEKRMVWLRVLEYKELSPFPNLKNTLTPVLEGKSTTIEVGEHLHIVAVTAKVQSGAQPLGPEKLYFYNLFFTNADNPPSSVSLTDINLSTEGNTAPINFTIHYEHEPANPDPQHVNHVHLPSFSLPPDDLNSLRIVHGSCRKPNAEGLDAMPAIDQMVSTDWKQPSDRPHFLFLTGDQIYADDVSIMLLHMFIDSQNVFMGTSRLETFLPETINKKLKIEKEHATSEVVVTNSGTTWSGTLPPAGKRGALAKHFAKFSDSDFHNHLISLGEYCAIYLFNWSDVLWIKPTQNDTGLPEFEDVYPNQEKHIKTLLESKDPQPTKLFKNYTEQVKQLSNFVSTLAQVRRALANVPTYMIFDDHDVTDDWFMTFNWCENVLSNQLGKRIVQNGMIAYALFQGWGNNPAQFDAPKPGGKLLNIIGKKWSGGYLDAPAADITAPLGLPASMAKQDVFKIVNGENELNAVSDIIEWNFHIVRTKFEIIALDGRTKRAYPVSSDPKAREFWHASIISQDSFKKQVPILVNKPELTIIISPTSIINIPAIDFNEFTFLGELLAECKTKTDETLDVYDHWRNQSNTFEVILHHIATRGAKVGSDIVTQNLILTGDVHFCSAIRLTYQNLRMPQDTDKTPANAVFAQLSSSSFKKQTSRTRLLHHNGYKFTTMTGLEFEKPGLYVLLHITVIGNVLIFIVDRIANLLGSDPVYFLEPKLPSPKEFVGWEGRTDFGTLTQLKVKSQNILGKLYEALAEKSGFKPDYSMIPVKPITVLTKDQALHVKDTVLPNVRWRYKTDYILSENEIRETFLTKEFLDVGNPNTPNKNQALKEYLKASKNHSEYTKKWGSGKEIVGLNNVSEISFDWQAGQQKIIEQKSWWNLDPKKENEPPRFFPLTKFKVSMDFKIENLPNL